MGVTAKNCQTLAEYREEVLKGKTQDDIAEDVGDGCSQPWVSQVENGHLPGHRHGVRDRFVAAYQLQGQEEEFVRMVRTAARLKALRKPMSETEPLLASATAERRGKVERLPESHPEVQQVRAINE